jgi:hypothetical protein
MLPGRPLGSEDLVSEMAERFGRYWTRGGPKKKQALARPTGRHTAQLTLSLRCLHKAKTVQLRLSPFTHFPTPFLHLAAAVGRKSAVADG